jgi:hypothetical protein
MDYLAAACRFSDLLEVARNSYGRLEVKRAYILQLFEQNIQLLVQNGLGQVELRDPKPVLDFTLENTANVRIAAAILQVYHARGLRVEFARINQLNVAQFILRLMAKQAKWKNMMNYAQSLLAFGKREMAACAIRLLEEHLRQLIEGQEREVLQFLRDHGCAKAAQYLMQHPAQKSENGTARQSVRSLLQNMEAMRSDLLNFCQSY